METTVKNQIKIGSKVKSVFMLCVVSITIAFLVTMVGKIDIQNFVSNILAWDTI